MSRSITRTRSDAGASPPTRTPGRSASVDPGASAAARATTGRPPGAALAAFAAADGAVFAAPAAEASTGTTPIPPAGHAATGGFHRGISIGGRFTASTGDTGTDFAPPPGAFGSDGAAATSSGAAKTPATTTSATTIADQRCNLVVGRNRTRGSNNRRPDTTALPRSAGAEAQIIIHR
ncbi:hypothetical protein Vau01_125040 [Virgisporangium aurantiacum]|uniref:Uncharacterized protein n=1 Tax=Virgisporangium aurantiacum TaxID=175570 RepID=A0A8J3ZNM0_9ACTN|nr:hypothetical protein Vau01_125040 [Virgisporangium aurantiacum]